MFEKLLMKVRGNKKIKTKDNPAIENSSEYSIEPSIAITIIHDPLKMIDISDPIIDIELINKLHENELIQSVYERWKKYKTERIYFSIYCNNTNRRMLDCTISYLYNHKFKPINISLCETKEEPNGEVSFSGFINRSDQPEMVSVMMFEPQKSENQTPKLLEKLIRTAYTYRGAYGIAYHPFGISDNFIHEYKKYLRDIKYSTRIVFAGYGYKTLFENNLLMSFKECNTLDNLIFSIVTDYEPMTKFSSHVESHTSADSIELSHTDYIVDCNLSQLLQARNYINSTESDPCNKKFQIKELDNIIRLIVNFITREKSDVLNNQSISDLLNSFNIEIEDLEIE